MKSAAIILILSGCHSSPPAQAPASTLQMSSASCAKTVEQLETSFCDPARQAMLAGDHQNAGEHAREAIDLMRKSCQSPEASAAFAKLDACIAQLTAAEEDEGRAQAQRLGPERARIPALRADARYSAALERLHTASYNARVSRDNAVATRGSSHAYYYQAHIDEADHEYARIVRELDKLEREYGIDPRDAKALGLW